MCSVTCRKTTAAPNLKPGRVKLPVSMSRWGTRIIALLCYVLAQVGSVLLVGWVFYQGLGYRLASSPWGEPWPWIIDLGFVLLFGLQHSGMARASFKDLWTRFIPASLERSIYAALSGLLVTATVLLWQPVSDAVLWRGPIWLIAAPVLAAVAILWLNTCFDHAGSFGLRQAWAGSVLPPSPLGGEVRGEPSRSPPTPLPRGERGVRAPSPPTPLPSGERGENELFTHGPYRYVRHPLMLSLLCLLWTQPVVTVNLAVFNAGMTLYIAVGVLLEERDLGRRFHPGYAAYRRRVPALLPWRFPRERSR